MKHIPGYGRSPLHLLGVIFCYALAAYAGARMIDEKALYIILAYPGGILLHDFVLLPLYSSADRKMSSCQQASQKPGDKLKGNWINYVRFPFIVTGLLLILYFPLILRLAEERPLFTSLSPDPYLYRWLIVSAVFFGAAGLRYFLTKRKVKSKRP